MWACKYEVIMTAAMHWIHHAHPLSTALLLRYLPLLQQRLETIIQNWWIKWNEDVIEVSMKLNKYICENMTEWLLVFVNRQKARKDRNMSTQVYLSRTVPLVAMGLLTSLSPVPLPWLRLGLHTLLTAAEGKSSGGSSGQPNCSLVLP